MSETATIFEGDLSGIDLPDVLTFISMTRKSGDLHVERDAEHRTLFWKDGEVVFANSNSSDHSLGEFLLRNGKITQEQYEKSCEMMEPGVKHGRVLVQLGYLSPKDLWWGVKAQVLEIIFSLFAWNEGRFRFLPSEQELQEKITLQINTSMLIMEGIRRLDESGRIDERITSDKMVFDKVQGAEINLEDLDLGEKEQKIWDQIDGEKTVRDLVRVASKMTEFEVRQLLYQMLSAHLIDEVEQKQLQPVFLDVEDSPDLLRVISVYNDMFEHLYGALLASVGDARTRTIFAAALSETERDAVWEGVRFGDSGRFDENMLVANISELPTNERKKVLDEGLNNLLSMQLFEVSQHLPAERKNEIFEFISNRRNEIEAIRVG